MDAPFIDQYQAQKIQPPSAPSERGCCGSRRGIVCALLKGLVIKAIEGFRPITPSRKNNAQKDHKNPWNAVRATAGHSFALYILSLESSFHYRRIPAPT